ncbi:MAG: PDZ domain-containing protein [Rhodocyclaceae bacterium]
MPLKERLAPVTDGTSAAARQRLIAAQVAVVKVKEKHYLGALWLDSGVIALPVLFKGDEQKEQAEVLDGVGTELGRAIIKGADQDAHVTVLQLTRVPNRRIELPQSTTPPKLGDRLFHPGKSETGFLTVHSSVLRKISPNFIPASGCNPADGATFLETEEEQPSQMTGPIFDRYGALVGLNQAFWKKPPPYRTFAIDSKYLLDVAQQIIQNGHVPRGWIGVSVGEITASLRREFQFPKGGVIVHDVVRGGPADKVGIMATDVILQMDDKVVSDPALFVARIGCLPPKHLLNVVVYRQGKKLSMAIPMQQRP